MVVNRKQPTVPQAVSRSASTQHVPTKRPLTKNAPRRNGVAEIDYRASTPKAAKHSAKKRRPRTFLDRLFLLSLSLFAFYAFYTCRPNPLFASSLHTQSVETNPLCRSLHGYRVHILDPYILPSVRHTVAFTHDITEPYITAAQTKAEPYIAPIAKRVNTVKPYVIRIVDTGKAIWIRSLVPFYKGTLKPYYVQAVLPRYNRYIQPRLTPLAARASASYTYYVSRPLHIQATKLNNSLHQNYHTYAEPYVAKVQPYVTKTYNTAHTVTLQAADLYQSQIHPHVVTTWVLARPHLCTAWKHTKVFALKAAEISAVQLKFALRQLGAYRRTYVDPHVHKIWEKVAEGTEGASVTVPIATKAPLVDDLPDTIVEATASIAEPTSVTAAEQTQTTPVPPTPEVIVEDTNIANPSVPTPEENADAVDPVGESTHVSEESVVDIPAEVTSSKAPEPSHTDAPVPTEEEQAEAVESVDVSKPVTSSSSTTPASTAQATKAAESVAAASLGGDDLDLDAFLNDIGVEETATGVVDASSDATSAAEASQPSVSIVISEADAAQLEEEKIAAIAEKRNKLVARHEKWFDQLDELIANETQALVGSLSAWRAEKSAELADMAGRTGHTTGIVNEVQKEGERLIKGLESYLKKAATLSDQWVLSSSNPAEVEKEEREAKIAVSKAEKDKWAKVLSKVEGKFGEKVASVQASVHKWFVSAREKELDDVKASALNVKNLAERAQADIGLDYAWLEDVTYADWQSYHDLMRAYEVYEQTAHSLQNGTALPEPAIQPPADPIIPALDTLHKELQDVILGFSVALGPVRSEAAKVFNVRRSTGEDDDDDSGFFVVRDGEVRKDDLRGVDLGALKIEKKDGAGVVKGNEAKDADEVHILPIGAGPGEAGEALDPASIFVGKDRVQVEQALGSVPLEPAAARHEEL